MDNIKIPINSWQEFTDIMVNRPYRRYIYRGQKDSSWQLETTLKRALSSMGVNHRYWEGREKSIIETFQKRAHIYLRHLPATRNRTENLLEWLSIMQHFGAPTRLLDWSYSPFVAAFYSLEELSENSCVWEIDYKMLRTSNIKNAGIDLFQKFSIKITS